MDRQKRIFRWDRRLACLNGPAGRRSHHATAYNFSRVYLEAVMSLSRAVERPKPVPSQPRTTWTYDLRQPCRGLSLAREKRRLLVWDAQPWLYLLDHAGALQAQRRLSFTVTAACAADDGSAYAVVGEHGEVHWLAPDLMPRWERVVPERALAAALDSHGQYLLVSEQRGRVHCFDRLGRKIGHIISPRPLYHLAFVPEASLIVGCSDFGLIGCFDLAGQWCWRHGPVSHLGGLAVGTQFAVTACYTHGLHFFGLDASCLPPPVTWPCRQVSLSFDGQLALIAWLDRQLHLVSPSGQKLLTVPVDDTVVALSLHALGDSAVVALAEGRILGLDLGLAAQGKPPNPLGLN